MLRIKCFTLWKHTCYIYLMSFYRQGPAVAAVDTLDQDCEDQLSPGLGSFSLAGQPAGDFSLHSSGASNLDSVMIDKVIRTWQESSAGEAGQFQPSLFQPFPPDPTEVVVSQQPLPRPLLPVNIDPTATFVPELLPRQPAPYRCAVMSQWFGFSPATYSTVLCTTPFILLQLQLRTPLRASGVSAVRGELQHRQRGGAAGARPAPHGGRGGVPGLQQDF